MIRRAAPSPRQRALVLRALQLFFAGLYAFVLPFICWGAQATPGHPHARAHFVFVEPEPSNHAAAEAVPAEAAIDEAITHAEMDHHGGQPMVPVQTKPAASTRQPVGRATPSMSGVTLLLLIGGAAIQGPCRWEGPSYSYWFSPLAAIPFTSLIPTPPPR